MKNNISDVFFKYNAMIYKFLNSKKEHMIRVLLGVLSASFLFSICMIFLNYDNLFSKKVFYFHSSKGFVSNLRYLRDEKDLKDNLDLLVKDFLLGSNEGFSFGFLLSDTRFLYSFLKNGVYYVNLSREFYDSFNNGDYNESNESFDVKVNLFAMSLIKTMRFNYPGKLKKIVILVEGCILKEQS
ncbi:GerMN domain-containing protein [Borreliella burgdorferi]|uniref:GerMN domain-containing protein n=1 Tax=Borreliella burgdorferi TaxID=139 RepID=UPI00017F3597|nr:GerMN domain-containing protein [Borreliella burgdorferi]MCD2374121.1 GerMN domain-containing protein [Borreliella burgdorferi]MCD2383636.1 GerMN domain-containing protein [Borreliella burgdorferi]MCD2384207.1 GerMN domain-containing protein [Borreliella burgdorferi]MCD2389452.1 GerMN domain-containing protein [Borreliella burgdorferi]MCD2393076.1 GerMN domain-containing protein [Borreliella burgdorferi]